MLKKEPVVEQSKPVETQPVIEQSKPVPVTTAPPKEEPVEPKESKQKKVVLEEDPKQKKKQTQNENQKPKAMTMVQGSSGSAGAEDFKDFGPNQPKPRLSFIGKRQSQVKVSFTKKDLARTDFDDSIEDGMFSKFLF